MTTPTHLLHQILLDEGLSDTTIVAIKELVKNILDEEIAGYIEAAKESIEESISNRVRNAEIHI